VLKFQVDRQNSIYDVPKKENRVRFKSFAAIDPANTPAVAPAPVVRALTAASVLSSESPPSAKPKT
jgi:hypothetical protein